MEKQLVARLRINFEDTAYEENGVEYWLARDMQILLDYTQWRNFEQVIEKAKIAVRLLQIILLTSAKRSLCRKVQLKKSMILCLPDMPATLLRRTATRAKSRSLSHRAISHFRLVSRKCWNSVSILLKGCMLDKNLSKQKQNFQKRVVPDTMATSLMC